jgi:hypothetical protein
LKVHWRIVRGASIFALGNTLHMETGPPPREYKVKLMWAATSGEEGSIVVDCPSAWMRAELVRHPDLEVVGNSC